MISWPSKSTLRRLLESCGFALHNIRKIRPFLTEHAAQLLVQALVISRLDYCNPLLAGTSIKHNQTSTNDSECSGTTGLQWAQKSTCHTSLCLYVTMSVFEEIDSYILEEIVSHLKSSTCSLETLPTSFFQSVLNCLEADLLEVVNASLLSWFLSKLPEHCSC